MLGLSAFSGDKWRCHRCATDGRTNERTREEDNNATQPLDAGRLSFATNVKNAASHYLNHVI